MKEKADYEVLFETSSNKLDIGIGINKEGFWDSQVFSFDELKGYFKELKHKRFIVVTISKNVLSEKEMTKLIDKLRLYFTDVGYQRIVITQASSDIEWSILLDKKIKP